MDNQSTAAAAEPGFEFVISREFNAPRDLVFKAWTEEEHLLRWMGPKQTPLKRLTNDLRTGGTMHYCMEMPDGTEYWGKWTYRQIIPPEYLEVLVSFADAEGNIARNPWQATWPLQTLSKTTFTEQAGRTTLTLQWTAYAATPEEAAAFAAPQAQAGMKAGWGGTMDKLEEYLGSLK
jgi:uncharacterized protein YndB with AHSA1/START domain